MLILRAADVPRAASMLEAIEAMRGVFETLGRGEGTIPPRIHMDLPGGTGLFMPALVGEALAIKAFAAMEENASRGLATFQGATLLLDPETGICRALIDAAALTALRTGASAGLSAQLLARPDSPSCALFGAGPQAHAILRALLSVRPLNRVLCLARHVAQIESWQTGLSLQVCDAAEMVSQADIVACATSARSPLFPAEAIRPGTHVIAVGSYRPEMNELPPALVRRARIFIDNLDAPRDSGDLAALEENQPTPLLTPDAQRVDDQEVTLYKSIGNAAQDAAAALLVWQNALAKGLGHSIDWP